MSKDIFIDEYDKLYFEVVDSGEPINEDKMSNRAYNRMRDRYADMCDEVKDRAKYAAL